MRARAAEIGAFALVFAALLNTASAQSPPPSVGAVLLRPNLAPPPRSILGTLDPATGIFTPDGIPPGGSDEVAGNIKLKLSLDLDPLLQKSPRSVYCKVKLTYRYRPPGQAEINTGQDDPSAIALTQKGAEASGALSIPYDVLFGDAIKGGILLADIVISCAAFGYPATDIVSETVALSNGDTPVSLSGSF